MTVRWRYVKRSVLTPASIYNNILVKFILSTIVFFLLADTLLTGQTLVGVRPDYEENHYAYFFKQFNFLREDIKLDKNKVYDKNDSLELFIADSIRFHNNYFYYHQRSPHACQNRFYKSGFVDVDKGIIVPFEYDWVQPKYDSFLLAKKGNATGIISNIGKLVFPFSHGFYHIHDNTLIAFSNIGIDSVILFYDTKRKFLFQINAFFAKRMSENYVSVAGMKGKFKGIVDINGRLVIGPDEYDNVKWIHDDFICAYKNNKFGVIDSKKKVVLPFEYDGISPAENDQFIIYKNGMSGVVNAKNDVVIPLDSIYIENFGKLYVVRKRRSDLSGLVNLKGEQLLERKYNINIQGNSAENEFKRVKPQSVLIIRDPETSLSGMYRADGLRILPVEYSYINYNQDCNAIIIGKKADILSDSFLFAAVDINGKILVPFSRNQLRILDRSPNLLLAKNTNGLAAFVNAKTGEIFTAYEFDEIEPLFPLTNSFIVAKKNWHYALISPDGKKLTDAVYSGFSPVTEKNKLWFPEEIVCLGRLGEKLYGITKTGKAIPAKQ